jgi:Transposase IS66 family
LVVQNFPSGCSRGKHPRAHLAAFHGFLQADGYSGFGPLYETANGQPATVSEIACWAHVRRKFYDIHVTSNASIAGEALRRVGQLFDVERGAMGRPPEQRRLLRQRLARAAFLDASLATISGRSELANALADRRRCGRRELPHGGTGDPRLACWRPGRPPRNDSREARRPRPPTPPPARLNP